MIDELLTREARARAEKPGKLVGLVQKFAGTPTLTHTLNAYLEVVCVALLLIARSRICEPWSAAEPVVHDESRTARQPSSIYTNWAVQCVLSNLLGYLLHPPSQQVSEVLIYADWKPCHSLCWQCVDSRRYVYFTRT